MRSSQLPLLWGESRRCESNLHAVPRGERREVLLSGLLAILFPILQVVKRLAVSGAFHTRQMNSAVEVVAEALKLVPSLPTNPLRGVKLESARANVYSNESGHIYPTKTSEVELELYGVFRNESRS